MGTVNKNGLEPCPFCNSPTPHTILREGNWQGFCGGGCGALGPVTVYADDARRRWNRRVGIKEIPNGNKFQG